MQLTFEDFASALSLDYECVFFVDNETSCYSMRVYRGEHQELKLVNSNNFWDDVKVNVEAVVYPEDKQSFADHINHESLLKAIQDGNVFEFKYRLVIAGEPVWFQIKAVFARSHGHEFLVIGVNNVDKRERERIELEKKASKGEVFGRIVMALAERYDALYMVDLVTNHYALYKSERLFCELCIAFEGDDFFNQLQKDALSVIYKEDIPLIVAALKRESLLRELDEHAMFSLTYRLNSPAGPQYVNLVAVYADKNHVVISVTNVDAQVRREQKIREEANLAFEKSRRDDLTGIKNKNAYGEFETKLNRQIQSKEPVEFAVAICDVNGLKTVNDTQGHKVGDIYIKKASKLVCETFKHSPVFRVGGDEFVVILLGSDYENREKLEQDFVKKVNDGTGKNKVSLACGISVFDPAHDKNVSVVFERADALMYKNKESMKGGRDEIIDAVV
ncbi:GGDEF domain-containing protein [Fibrobacter sp. UWH4]|uniref:GGDEF domain-containing protein n=1 Tax=Fibrobacter sp. UWH4 TaxID=1896210 RepID=UPI00090F31F1|nr:GGDEF domain-containing protein [Fibrobacter sp. UWH4]SHL17574.1 diguanylate cyclase (GGDEF) domain-containing protein [Fibrobacter sp. UWH4]